MNLQKIIKSKKFDWVNSNITEKNFPTPARLPNEKTEYKLFNFDRYISSEDIIKEIEKEGYLPANLYELLDWKDWNNKDWVVALGSVGRVYGLRSVPCLRRDDSERILYLHWWVSGWYSDCRFLAVRNLSLKPLDTSASELRPFETLTLESAIKICKENGLEVYKPL